MFYPLAKARNLTALIHGTGNRSQAPISIAFSSAPSAAGDAETVAPKAAAKKTKGAQAKKLVRRGLLVNKHVKFSDDDDDVKLENSNEQRVCDFALL